jgi:hypothetical protein
MLIARLLAFLFIALFKLLIHGFGIKPFIYNDLYFLRFCSVFWKTEHDSAHQKMVFFSLFLTFFALHSPSFALWVSKITTNGK